MDLEEDLKTAKAGPWQRCFNCGMSGDMKVLKKCGVSIWGFFFLAGGFTCLLFGIGACGGKATFCDATCQKEGWREHRQRHNCRKA